MRYGTNQERRVKQELKACYGSNELESVVYVDENEYMARLYDGTLVKATVQDDGTIDIKENPPWC